MSTNLENRQYIHFSVLTGLLVLAGMFHYGEDWGNRTPTTFIFSILTLGLIFEKLQKWLFLLFTLVMTYYIAGKFPNLANHSNLYLIVLIVVLPLQLQVARNKLDLPYADLMKTIRCFAFVLYFFTFFHKLNWDFLNPEVTCASDKLDGYLDLIPRSWGSFRQLLETIAPAGALLVEGLIPLGLILPPLRKLAIYTILALHFMLAPMGFSDFSSLGFAMAWTFVDVERLNIESLPKHFLYLASFCLTFELWFAPTRIPQGRETYEFLEGVLFGLSYAFFAYKYILVNIDCSPLKLPKSIFYKLCILTLFIFGSSNYLGLRTAGNFSMFSNLKTEGETSNHLLLGSNPFKIFGFQEDVVRVISVSRSGQKIYRRMPAAGQKIPRIEFNRLMKRMKSRSRGRKVKMEVEYQGKRYKSANAGYDLEFSFEVPWWQTKFFKFRRIQKEGPQRCSW